MCIYNLHAVPQTVGTEPSGAPEALSFHLHGGTSYGRGLCVLPADSPDVLKLKRYRRLGSLLSHSPHY